MDAAARDFLGGGDLKKVEAGLDFDCHVAIAS